MPPVPLGTVGVFQEVLMQFQAITAAWLGQLYRVGTNLFFALATIELILVAIAGTLRRDLEQMVIDLVRTIAGVMAIYTLFKYGPDWLRNGVIGSFQLWAYETGGIPASAMDPGGVMLQGLNLALILLQAIAAGWAALSPSTYVNALMLLGCAVIIIVCFTVIAVNLLEILVEAYVACVAGTALVATSGTRFTWRFAEGYFGWALGIAVRLFFAYLMIAVGIGLVGRWVAQNQSVQSQLMTNWYYGIEAAIEAYLLMVLTTRIPAKAAAIVEGTVSMTLGDIVLSDLITSTIREGMRTGIRQVRDNGVKAASRAWQWSRSERLRQ